LLLLFLCCVLLSSAQQFHGGALAGFTASQVDGDGYGGFDKSGFTVGLFVNRKLNDKYTWQTEINYSQRGSKKNMNPNKNDYTFYKIHLEYVEVPFLLVYNFSETINFLGGLSVGRLIKSYEENEIEQFVSNPFNKVALNSIIGIQYKFSDRLYAGLRETYSIVPIRGFAEQGRFWYKTGSFNNSLSFTMNYFFKN